ncbi:MAG: hypothetical protein JJE39_17935 [Vicinamibacteria bacterium]|nr:hypothetical protein [Vicinamibacteria bacterium]
MISEPTAKERTIAALAYVPPVLLIGVVAAGNLTFLVPLAFLVFAVAAHWREGRIVWPYADADTQLPTPTSYMVQAARSAEQFSFRPVVTVRNARAPLFKVRYEFWTSGDREILLIAGAGTVAVMPVECSWLYSRLDDGTMIASMSDLKGMEYDLSGLVKSAVFPGASLEKLIDRHRDRLTASGRKILRYSERGAVSEHRDALRRRVARLSDLGYAAPKDPAWERWSYTIPGALQVTARSYTHGLIAAVKAMKW